MTAQLAYRLVQGGDVPGVHNVIDDGKRKPFITPMAECSSIALRYSDVVVDIGAYVGTYAIRAARFPVKRVVAYEPTPLSFQILSLSKLPNLEVHQKAVVGAPCDCVDFYLSRGIGVTNSIVASEAKDKISVDAVTYEQAIEGATIVKIDIEGGEYSIPTIVAGGLRALIVDFHKVGRDWIEKAERIIDQIERAGFVAVIKPNWSNGWTCAGSWQRDLPDVGGCFEPMMSGDVCCGCGAAIRAAGSKAVCEVCAPHWKPKHRIGYRAAYRL